MRFYIDVARNDEEDMLVF